MLATDPGISSTLMVWDRSSERHSLSPRLVLAGAVGPVGGSASVDGPPEGQSAVPRPSDGQKPGHWRGVRHGIPLPTLSVLKFHYQVRILAFPVGLPPQHDSHLRVLGAVVHAESLQRPYYRTRRGAHLILYAQSDSPSPETSWIPTTLLRVTVALGSKETRRRSHHPAVASFASWDRHLRTLPSPIPTCLTGGDPGARAVAPVPQPPGDNYPRIRGPRPVSCRCRALHDHVDDSTGLTAVPFDLGDNLTRR